MVRKKKKLYEKYASYLGGKSYVSRIGILESNNVTPVNDGNVLLLQSGYLLIQNASKLLLNS